MDKEKIYDFVEVDRTVMAAVRTLSRKIQDIASSGGKKEEFMENLPESIEGRVRQLMETPPVFFEGDLSAETKTSLDKDIKDMLPEEFFADPTKWIESQEDVPRRYTIGRKPVANMKKIEELWERAYDTSRTKKILLEKDGKQVRIFSKRLKPEEVGRVEACREAYKADVPTPKILGTVSDKGNTYCWSEYINGITLQEISNDKLFDTPLTATAEIQFDGHVGEIECLKTRPGFRNQLISLWRTHIPDITSFNLANSLQSFIDQCRNGIPHGDMAFTAGIGFLIFLPKNARNVPFDLKDILQQHGYGSLEEFCEFFSKCLCRFDEKTVKEKLPDFEKITQELKRLALEAMRIYVKKWRDIVSKELFGDDSNGIAGEKQRLQVLCEKHGLGHKDSNDNFLISLPDKGKAKLYVINVSCHAKAEQ